jgi:hypothetical protein
MLLRIEIVCCLCEAFSNEYVEKGAPSKTTIRRLVNISGDKTAEVTAVPISGSISAAVTV